MTAGMMPMAAPATSERRMNAAMTATTITGPSSKYDSISRKKSAGPRCSSALGSKAKIAMPDARHSMATATPAPSTVKATAMSWLTTANPSATSPTNTASRQSGAQHQAARRACSGTPPSQNSGRRRSVASLTPPVEAIPM